jgi:hypothetical protein
VYLTRNVREVVTNYDFGFGQLGHRRAKDE